jgi:hypothetical protein
MQVRLVIFNVKIHETPSGDRHFLLTEILTTLVESIYYTHCKLEALKRQKLQAHSEAETTSSACCG